MIGWLQIIVMWCVVTCRIVGWRIAHCFAVSEQEVERFPVRFNPVLCRRVLLSRMQYSSALLSILVWRAGQESRKRFLTFHQILQRVVFSRDFFWCNVFRCTHRPLTWPVLICLFDNKHYRVIMPHGKFFDLEKKMFKPLGMSKHRKSGYTTPCSHFTGCKGGKRLRRKGKDLSRKERRKKRGTHKNKYAHLSQVVGRR